MRGACLKARFEVNGIQKAARSLGTVAVDGVWVLSSMMSSSECFSASHEARNLSASPGRVNVSSRAGCDYFSLVGRFQGGPKPHGSWSHACRVPPPLITPCRICDLSHSTNSTPERHG